MSRKPQQPAIACQFFTWRLFRRDGVYYADGRGGKFDLGKHSLGTRDREEALESLKLLDRQKAVELGLASAQPDQPLAATSITEGWQAYLDYSGRAEVLGGVSARTLKRYRAVRDKHVKFCARRGIGAWAEFDKRAIELYGNCLAKKYAPRTVYLELTLLKSVNGWLVDNGKLSAEARVRYALRKPQGTDTYCYSRQEVAAMVAHCTAAPALHWMVSVIVALAHTGLRIDELAQLRWSDLDFGLNTIRVTDERASSRKRRAGTVRTTKGRRSRTIPIHPQLRTALDQLPHAADGRVFHAAQGGPLRPRNVLHAFIRDVIRPLQSRFPTAVGDIGFEHGWLHSFRHFFCSQSFLGGASEGEIKEWLGHADSKMVDHYRHLRNEDARRKMSQIDFLGGASEDPADGERKR